VKAEQLKNERIYFCKVHETVEQAINQPQKCSLGAIKEQIHTMPLFHGCSVADC
jgi:hypothetical protein